MQIAYQSIQNFSMDRAMRTTLSSNHDHPLDPELVCQERILPASIEEEIKDGFFELKQKFKESGPSSIYISHVVLHEKHPLLRKLKIETLKLLLIDSTVIYLSIGQSLYTPGSNDQLVYIVLFGRLNLQVPSGREGEEGEIIGRVNLGWTLGEEILFDRGMQIR